MSELNPLMQKINDFFMIGEAAARRGWKVVDKRVMMPCPRPAMHNHSATPKGAGESCEDCHGTRLVPADYQLTCAATQLLNKRGGQLLTCQLPVDHIGVHADGEIYWRSKPAKKVSNG